MKQRATAFGVSGLTGTLLCAALILVVGFDRVEAKMLDVSDVIVSISTQFNSEAGESDLLNVGEEVNVWASCVVRARQNKLGAVREGAGYVVQEARSTEKGGRS